MAGTVPPGYRVRAITPDDIQPAAAVHVQIWREAYRGLLPDHFLAGLDEVQFAASRRSRMEQGVPVGGVDLVAVDSGGAIVALGTAGPGRDEDRPGEWELFAINVLQRAQGTGLADAMLAELLGQRPAYLWVLPGNARAIAFYARHGFRPDGSSKPFPPTGQTEIRLVR